MGFEKVLLRHLKNPDEVTGMLPISEKVVGRVLSLSFLKEKSHKGAIVSEHSCRHSETAFGQSVNTTSSKNTTYLHKFSKKGFSR